MFELEINTGASRRMMQFAGVRQVCDEPLLWRGELKQSTAMPALECGA